MAADDKIINPDLQRFCYQRAHSHTTVLAGASHSVYESGPKEVAAVIEDEAKHAQQYCVSPRPGGGRLAPTRS